MKLAIDMEHTQVHNAFQKRIEEARKLYRSLADAASAGARPYIGKPFMYKIDLLESETPDGVKVCTLTYTVGNFECVTKDVTDTIKSRREFGSFSYSIDEVLSKGYGKTTAIN
jgi:hypothetical protein